MTIAVEVREGRLVARIINLAHRFGCSYENLNADRRDGVFVATIALTGPADALRRLQPQITKLLEDEKEYFR